VLDLITKGDVLMVTRVDRLAHSTGDLQDIVRMLKTKGASLRATEQPIDTSTAAGKCFLDMLGVFAEFKTNLRRERQLEGIAKGECCRRVQGPEAIYRSGSGRKTQSRWLRRYRDRQAAKDRPSFGHQLTSRYSLWG
jgi:DNA invertase Pin-like site-specific DNA recombinase